MSAPPALSRWHPLTDHDRESGVPVRSAWVACLLAQHCGCVWGAAQCLRAPVHVCQTRPDNGQFELFVVRWVK